MQRAGFEVERGVLEESLRGLAAWMEAASGPDPERGYCHRIATYYEDGRMSWLYPHSNTGETISVWLDLAEMLDCPQYEEWAYAYARRMIDDPVKGIYRGEEKSAHGLAWYWTDGGSYSGLYAMRMPYHYRRIYEKTGYEPFLDICSVIGGTLRERLRPSGLVDAGWSPTNGWAEGGVRCGCRFIHSMATFATLYDITRDPAYEESYERSLKTLQHMQQPDGGFYQHYSLATADPLPQEGAIKPFFYSYILNALEEAYRALEDERLLEIGRRLGWCLVRLYRYRNAIPYCIGEELLPADRVEADTAIFSVSNGLLWLHSVTGVEEFLTTGQRIWLDAYGVQWRGTERPGWHGAILQGANPDLATEIEGVPTNRMHLRAESGRMGKCTLWEVVNHALAARRMWDAY